jgi:hypothetical protein
MTAISLAADENWVQIELSTTSPAPAKPTPTYPDGSLFTEEIPAGASRPTPPTFSPVSQTTTTESPLIMEPPLNMTDYKQGERFVKVTLHFGIM